MNWIHLFWHYLNWLEFITFILIPVAIVLLTLVYLYFNLRLIRLSMDSEIDELAFMSSISDTIES